MAGGMGLIILSAALGAEPALSTQRGDHGGRASEPGFVVACRDGYLAGMGTADIWSAAKAVGIRQLEVAVAPDLGCPNLYEQGQRPYRIDTHEARAKLAARLAEHRMSICAFAAVVGFRPSDEDAELADAVAWLGRIAEAADAMGVPVVMVPIVAKELSDEQFVRRAIRLVKALVAATENRRVHWALENLGPYLNRREILEPILKAAPANRMGLALDITNLYWFGYPLAKVYALAEALAPYVRYVHVKNLRYPPERRQALRPMGWQYPRRAEPVRSGDIDFARVLRVLAKAGYHGPLTLEDDSLRRLDAAGKRRVLRDDVAFLSCLLADGNGR